jgi:hypothetical protein
MHEVVMEEAQGDTVVDSGRSTVGVVVDVMNVRDATAAPGRRTAKRVARSNGSALGSVPRLGLVADVEHSGWTLDHHAMEARVTAEPANRLAAQL